MAAPAGEGRGGQKGRHPEQEGGRPEGSPPQWGCRQQCPLGQSPARREVCTSPALEGPEWEPWARGGVSDGSSGPRGPARPLHCSSMLGA